MRKRMYCLLLLVLLTVGLLPVRAAEPEYTGYLVGISEEVPLLLEEDADLQPVVPGVYVTRDPELARTLERDPAVDYVEPDYVVTLFDAGSTEAPDWCYETVGGPYARELGLTGQGVRVGIIDTGLDVDNANLQGANLVLGVDFVKQGAEMEDTQGHGTCVAQSIAGRGTLGAVRGLAPQAELVAFRCFSKNYRTTVSVLVKALEAATTEPYRCDVVNMSWGIPNDSETLHNAIIRARNQGTVLVAAAGNAPQYTQGTVIYPAAYPEVLGVGALNREGQVAWCSQQTKAVSVSAPGEDVSFIAAKAHLKPEEQGTVRRKLMNGTSFASPYAAGAAALICQLLPESTPAEVQEIMTDRALDLGPAGYEHLFGYGAVRTRELFSRDYHRLQPDQEVLTLRGWFHQEPGTCLLAASYTPQGKMQACAMAAAAAPLTGYTLTLPQTEGHAILLYHLTATGTPLQPREVLEP